MAKATRSLSPNRAMQRMREHHAAVITLAQQRAKKVVLAELRAKGLRLADFSAREIALNAEAYMARHRERLISEAAQDVATWPGFARWRCAEINTNAQTENEPKSITSAVQISGAEGRAKQ